MTRQADFQSQHAERVQRLTTTLERVEELASQAGADRLTREALAFAWASAAWAAIDLAQLWVFERRLGMPQKETEAFDLLARDGVFGIDIARRLKQAVEFRNLATRPWDRIDWTYLAEGSRAERDLLRSWRDWARGLAETHRGPHG